MKKLLLAAALGAGLLLAACSSDNGGNSCTKKTCNDYSATCGTPSDNCGGTLQCGTCGTGLACGDGTNNSVQYVCGFPQPAGTVAINFKVDDATNKLYQNGQLAWKGSFAAFDGGTRVVTNDQGWAGGAGPYPTMYDDGPWNRGGHEPADGVAGDHIFGVTVFAKPPTTGSENYGFGLEDEVYHSQWASIAGPGENADGWMWVGDNGSFTVASTATGTINAGSYTLKPGGTVDLLFTIDVSALANDQTWDTSKVQFKSNAWYWGTVTLKDDGSTYGDEHAGDGIYTFRLSSVIPTPFVHTAFAKSTDKIEFIFMFNGSEYKNASNTAHTEGVTGSTRVGTSGSFTPVTVGLATNNNTQIVVP